MAVPIPWLDAQSRASEMLKRTSTECNDEFTLMGDGYSLYATAFDRMSLNPPGPAIAVRAAIHSQCLNTFYVMLESAAMAYYIQALIPLRHVYESWASLWYLSSHPDEAHKWLGKHPPPKAAKLLDGIDHPEKSTKSKLANFYGVLCRFAHIDPAAVVSRLSAEGDKTIVNVGIRFDVGDYRACVYAHALWLGMLLDSASTLVPVGDPWHLQQQALEDQFLAHIEQYNSDHSGPPLPPEEG